PDFGRGAVVCCNQSERAGCLADVLARVLEEENWAQPLVPRSDDVLARLKAESKRAAEAKAKGGGMSITGMFAGGNEAKATEEQTAEAGAKANQIEEKKNTISTTTDAGGEEPPYDDPILVHFREHVLDRFFQTMLSYPPRRPQDPRCEPVRMPSIGYAESSSPSGARKRTGELANGSPKSTSPGTKEANGSGPTKSNEAAASSSELLMNPLLDPAYNLFAAEQGVEITEWSEEGALGLVDNLFSQAFPASADDAWCTRRHNPARSDFVRFTVSPDRLLTRPRPSSDDRGKKPEEQTETAPHGDVADTVPLPNKAWVLMLSTGRVSAGDLPERCTLSVFDREKKKWVDLLSSPAHPTFNTQHWLRVQSETLTAVLEADREAFVPTDLEFRIFPDGGIARIALFAEDTLRDLLSCGSTSGTPVAWANTGLDSVSALEKFLQPNAAKASLASEELTRAERVKRRLQEEAALEAAGKTSAATAKSNSKCGGPGKTAANGDHSPSKDGGNRDASSGKQEGSKAPVISFRVRRAYSRNRGFLGLPPDPSAEVLAFTPASNPDAFTDVLVNVASVQWGAQVLFPTPKMVLEQLAQRHASSLPPLSESASTPEARAAGRALSQILEDDPPSRALHSPTSVFSARYSAHARETGPFAPPSRFHPTLRERGCVLPRLRSTDASASSVLMVVLAREFERDSFVKGSEIARVELDFSLVPHET
ncbi:unnamed protein product, partial [Amoebophrya sp. A25]